MQAIKNTLTSIPLVTHGIVSGWQHRDEVVDAARRRAPMAAGLAFLHAGGNHVVANGAYLIGRVGAENLAASARGYAGRAKALFWETIAGMGNRRGANADA